MGFSCPELHRSRLGIVEDGYWQSGEAPADPVTHGFQFVARRVGDAFFNLQNAFAHDSPRIERVGMVEGAHAGRLHGFLWIHPEFDHVQEDVQGGLVLFVPPGHAD